MTFDEWATASFEPAQARRRREWLAPVSKLVARLFTDKQIPGGAMPEELCEFEYVDADGAWWARLTQKGEAVLEALQWL